MNKDYEELKKSLEEDVEYSLNKFLAEMGLRATLKIKLEDIEAGGNYSIRDAYGVIDDLCLSETGKSIADSTRKREVVAYRQCYCKIVRDSGNYSLAVIGSRVNRDHATVVHSSKTVSNLLSTNDELITRIYNLCLISLTKKYIEYNEKLVEFDNSEQLNS